MRAKLTAAVWISTRRSGDASLRRARWRRRREPVFIRLVHALEEPLCQASRPLSTSTDNNTVLTITVWMRTAQRKQVVAIRTFLRTLLHELCHHLDYKYLKLEDSFHTEGFYKRETSLFQQITQNLDLPKRGKSS